MADAQSYKSHRRYIPAYHFFVLPVLVLNIVVEALRLNKYPTPYHVWMVLVAIALALLAIYARAMAATAQDRVIRLEERARLARLLPEADHARIDELAPRHFVGLRFASDEEVADLARRCLAGELKTANEVKKQVKNWRPDHLRV